MVTLAFLLSLCVVALGAVGVASPPRLLAFLRRFRGPAGLYAAAAFRLALGGALLLAAPASRAPEAVRILGLVMLVAGLLTPLVGRERFRRLLDWWAGRGPAFTRLWAALALLLGALLALAVAPV